MLIEFTVGNFRSFMNRVTLSMVAANTKARDPQININNTISVDENLSLLTSAAVYGANASGKSNLVAALAFMREFVLESSKETHANEPIRVSCFQLSTETENKPAFFEIIFLLEDNQYRYGFEVDNKIVQTEWLFRAPLTHARETRLFVRDNDEIRVAPRAFKEGKGLESRTRSNALFLSAAAQWNGEISTQIITWFLHMGIVSDLSDLGYRGFTLSKYYKGDYRENILKLIKELDLGIEDLSVNKMDISQVTFPSEIPDEIKKIVQNSMEKGDIYSIKTFHTKWDAVGQPVGKVEFDLEMLESAGTQKLFFLGGPLSDILKHGRLMVIDEMEAQLHPLMTRTIINLFNSIETNPMRAQLILTTHDTNQLSNKLFRRDQIWFIEKDLRGVSHLYSLAELKVRNDASFDSDYIKGIYGAIPFLGDLRQVICEE